MDESVTKPDGSINYFYTSAIYGLVVMLYCVHLGKVTLSKEENKFGDKHKKTQKTAKKGESKIEIFLLEKMPNK